MVSKYFKKVRARLFPWITDWTDPQNHIRHESDIRKLDWFEWFFLHPSAYLLTTFSAAIINVILFAGLAWYLYQKESFVSMICIAISCMFIYQTYTKIQTYRLNKDMNYYDVLMRDDEVIK